MADQTREDSSKTGPYRLTDFTPPQDRETIREH